MKKPAKKRRARKTAKPARTARAKTKKITTIVGTGVAGFKGDGGPATKAEITDSSGGYIDPSGNLLIGDSGNQRVRIVNKKGIINTLAGGGKTVEIGTSDRTGVGAEAKRLDDVRAAPHAAIEDQFDV